MKIVVLDGYTLNPGDLSWQTIEQYGEVVVYDRTEEKEIEQRAKDAEIVLTNKTLLKKETLSKLTNLKYIGVLATGYNIVDVQAAYEQGIIVTNVPSYSTDSVAQLVFAYILTFCHRVEMHTQSVRAGQWSNSRDFSYTLSPQVELKGKTIGIIGYGSIGKRVAEIAKVFGMNVLIGKSLRSNDENDVGRVPWEHIFRESDYITLHTPLTTDTKELINHKNISLMKRTAYLINTGRGGLVNEQDLADALNQGKIAGAAVDVLSTEPPSPTNPLLTARNCIITPHIAWSTYEARKRLMQIAADNIKAFIEGNPIHVVSLP